MIDTSILFHLAGQRGDNTPVLSIASERHVPETGATGGHVRIEGYGGFSPLRLTTVFFSPEHLQLAREVSVSTPPLDIFYTHAQLLNVTRTYMEHGEWHKVVRRIARRLYYWDDVPLFNFLNGTSFNSRDIQKELMEISDGGVQGLLHQLRSMAAPLATARELGKPNEELETALLRSLKAFILKEFNEHDAPTTINQALEYLDRVLDREIRLAVEKNPHLTAYIDFVLNHLESPDFLPFRENPVFMAFNPQEDFVEAYRKLLPILTERFSGILFSQPEDLHMTLAFAGKITEPLYGKVQAIYAEYSRKLAQIPVVLSKGALQIIGHNNSQLAIVFKTEDVPTETLRLIQEMKMELVAAGIRPDDHLEEFMPHISIGHLAQTYSNPIAHRQLNEILSSPLLPGALSSVTLNPKPGLFEVKASELEQGDEARYVDLSSVPSTAAVSGGIAPGDLK